MQSFYKAQSIYCNKFIPYSQNIGLSLNVIAVTIAQFGKISERIIVDAQAICIR